MNSIRTKLFLNISLVIIFFFLASWGLSTLVLEPLYVWHKKKTVLESGQLIASLYAEGSENITLELERIGNSLGAGIVILDPDGYIRYSSFNRYINPALHEKSSPSGSSPPQPPPLWKKSEAEVYGQATLQIMHDPGLSLNFIVLQQTLDNRDSLVIRLPLAAVSESASYASNFMAVTGILSILAGSIWAYIFARRFTVPLQEVSHVAKSISRLDFSQKCNVTGSDEIGSLAASINNLSSQLHKAIAELNKKNRQLIADVEKERNLDKLRRNFISSVSHELKTPLSLILGYAEGLKENISQDPENRNFYCSVIMDEAEKMDKLVKGLLNLSQIESGFFTLERSNFNLSNLIDEILLKYNTVLTERKITVERNFQPDIFVNADMLRTEQIIVNLLNNAIDHADYTRQLKLSLDYHSGKVRLSVFNTGDPIPEDSLQNLWLSFYKVDQARTRSLGGYGLGLSIVRAIQDLYGNAYGVENTGEGVRFWIALNPPA